VAFLNLTFVRRDCGIGDTNVKFTPLADARVGTMRWVPLKPFFIMFGSKHFACALSSVFRDRAPQTMVQFSSSCWMLFTHVSQMLKRDQRSYFRVHREALREGLEAMGKLFSSSIPAYFWLIIAYGVVLGVTMLGGSGAENLADPATAGSALCAAAEGGGARLECRLSTTLFTLPLLVGPGFGISITSFFIALAFVMQWIEAYRATRIRATGGNDLFSIILTLAALLLFVGREEFQTTAFMVVVIVGVGDVILDRIIGQAVARRDFGGMIGGG
jgi:hypothetical protein